MEAAPSLFMVLNQERQIVFANAGLLKFLGKDAGDARAIIGMRPGEALNCENCALAPSGCGTGEPCRCCGAVLAILDCLENGMASWSECHLRCEAGGTPDALDLRIGSSPLELEGRKYVVFCAVDISDERRRDYLESLFIHEIRDCAGNLLTLSGMLKDEFSEAHGSSEAAELLVLNAKRLMYGVDGHKMLIEAESGSLKVEEATFDPSLLLSRVADECATHPFADGKRISVEDPVVDMAIESDPAILSRALGNLVRNALEASGPGEKVKISCRPDGNCAVFEVWNKAAIKREDQFRIFTRAFSTKHKAGGVGAYMSRLLVERYLGGRLSFVSNEAHGTSFLLKIQRDRSRGKLE
jgi:signal transduction histidine kinase